MNSKLRQELLPIDGKSLQRHACASFVPFTLVPFDCFRLLYFLVLFQEIWMTLLMS